MKDRVNLDIGAKGRIDWDSINWRLVDKRVKNLRQRIFRATRECQWNKVRSLMKLMLRSFSNLLQSVRKITQKNKGKKTPGIDNRLALTSRSRAKLARLMMKYTPWKACPGRRIYIPKAGGKFRPLGILTLADRVAQAIVKNALEPSWEARFESNSYGFRPGRSCQDAIQHCWIRLNGNALHRWVLDADIQSAFDGISHSFILDKIGNIPGRELIKRWLKAGYVEEGKFFATTAGVQQGGVISPLLSNIALDGMQEMLGQQFGFIRYADDFVVTAKSKEELTAIKPKIESWLKLRGLALNVEKTHIVSVNDGFNFLGFNIRHYKGVCLTKPEKKKVLEFVKRIKGWLKQHPSMTHEMAIRLLNPVLYGWRNYYRYGVSKHVFTFVDDQVWRALWAWCLRRHPEKSMSWVKEKYFTECDGRQWCFFAKTKDRYGEPTSLYLAHLADVKIKRHVKVRGSASPDDPELASYWYSRLARQKHVEFTPWKEIIFDGS